MSAPDSVEPILGWRVWRFAGEGRLGPITASSPPWERGTNEARCHLRTTRHRAPGANCICGFNALHEPPEEFRGRIGYAIGAIAAWGEIDVYRTGFRAQYACILGLLADPPEGSTHHRNLLAVATHYGVPLLDRERLCAHVALLARPAGRALLPGIVAPRPGRRTAEPPLPLSATAARFEGRGVAVDRDLAVDHRRRLMRLGPTPALAALCDDRIEPQVGIGEVVSEDQLLFRARAAGSEIAVHSPLGGVVLAVNDEVPRYEEGPAGGGWLIELRLESDSLEPSAIAWGRRGAETYRDYVLAAGSDVDLLLARAASPVPAEVLLAADEARAWLRAFAQQLDTAIAADPGLGSALRALGEAVRFEVAGVESLRVGPPPLGGSRWASSGRSGAEAEAELVVSVRPADLRRYWRGELGLAPDEVAPSLGSSGADGPAARRAPLELRAGDRGRLLLARSLHERLFARSREILDGLGDPWFRAGDTVRDPVRNLEVLAGFERPGDLDAA